MTESHPLGDLTGSIDGDPSGYTNGEQPQGAGAASIVDDVLNLDSFLAGDVRRAEKTARFCTRPELEARIEELHAELETLTDNQGRPLPVIDQSVGDGERSALVVASEVAAVQREYAAALATVRLRAMDEDDWSAFQARHKKTLNEGELPYPPEFYEDLISCSEPLITFPGGKPEKVSRERIPQLRKALGHTAYNEIAQTAWNVNTSSGVSIPKSPLSSAVLRQQMPG